MAPHPRRADIGIALKGKIADVDGRAILNGLVGAGRMCARLEGIGTLRGYAIAEVANPCKGRSGLPRS